ncbi:hypothetical protein GCM10022223_65670 [Kineosporia mesophila]|uniref:Prepilin-type N-terminal cleavage/methylation domain-containing protein n=1 Tax=Kineosporia mesophila TaxID=566012 RepID=A0ABP7AQM8_9ACTN|nr:prepilin-type N-terminal cleavage/methylation domain-containing protein [Kineosporia mesophila]MCD5349181.1 prepilin-type N-terminal cleavage/methylation domain-containing protein [Kineosporia mesophila]
MSRIVGRRRRSAARRDDGVTLVELSVAMGVASILMVAIGVVFFSTLRGVTTVNTKTSTTADGRIVMEAMTRTMRVAVRPAQFDSAFVSAGTGQVSFYSLLNRTGTPATVTPLATLVSYSYDGTCINQTLTPPRTDSTGNQVWDTGAVTTCLGRTTTPPVFTYYGAGSGTTSKLSATPLSSNNQKLVRSIQIDLSIQDSAQPSVAPVILTDRVTLSNLQKSASNS